MAFSQKRDWEAGVEEEEGISWEGGCNESRFSAPFHLSLHAGHTSEKDLLKKWKDIKKRLISISKYIFDLMIINCGINTWVEQAW